MTPPRKDDPVVKRVLEAQVELDGRKRGSEREPHDYVREPFTKPKPLTAARSRAEITRVRQGWTLIILGLVNIAATIWFNVH